MQWCVGGFYGTIRDGYHQPHLGAVVDVVPAHRHILLCGTNGRAAVVCPLDVAQVCPYPDPI